MLKKELTGIHPQDTAVSMDSVSKEFIQWQRENAGSGIIKNLFKPEKIIKKALDHVSFSVKEGEFAAYAGPNGAGKSTTMKLLSGMLLPGEGDISVLGMDPVRNRIALMQRMGILFGNRTELWWDHPVSQSFEWKKAVWNIPDSVYEKNLSMACQLLDIKELMKTFARELSLGQRMRADLALMLLHGPRLILLDEPTLGLDVVAKRQMISFLKQINKEDKVTIIVTSHDMGDLEEMAERILMVSKGKLAFDGGFDELRSLTGNLTRLYVLMEDGKKPDLGKAKFLSVNHGIYEYQIDQKAIPVREVLGYLANTEGVRDVEIKKAPIEQVIAGLFQAWKDK